MLRKALLTLVWFELLLVVVVAQTSDKDFPTCGGPRSQHECHCKRLSDRIQTAREKECSKLTGEARIECNAKIPQHCDIIEQPDPDPTMSDQCTERCKRGDCKCDDGPTCHLMHSWREHKPE